MEFINDFKKWLSTKKDLFSKLEKKYKIETLYNETDGVVHGVNIDFMSKKYFARIQILREKEGWLTILDYTTGNSILEEHLDFTDNMNFDSHFEKFFKILIS